MEWLAEGLMVTILGFCTVFAVLIFISFVLFIFGKVASSKKAEVEKPQLIGAIPAVHKTLDGVTDHTRRLLGTTAGAVSPAVFVR